MQIQLEHIFYNNLSLNVKSVNKPITAKLKTTLDFKAALIDAEDTNHFTISFNLNLENKNFQFNVDATAVFQTNENLTSEFLNSNFCNINAPAIAFPYLRTYISNITLNSGFNPIILPSFNFIAFHQEKIREEN